MQNSERPIDRMENLLNPKDGHHLDLASLNQLCSSQDYHVLTDIVSVLTRLFLAGRKRKISRKSPPKGSDTPAKTAKEEMEFIIDELSLQELNQFIKCLMIVRIQLRDTVYSLRLKEIIEILKLRHEQLRLSVSQRQIQAKLHPISRIVLEDYEHNREEVAQFLNAHGLNSMGIANLSSRIAEILANVKQFFEGRFGNTLTLYNCLSEEVIPLFERHILSIPLNAHQDRERELERILRFCCHFYIQPFEMEVYINKSALMESRHYVNKLLKEFYARNRVLLLRKLTKIFNEALLCPSDSALQFLLFKILRRIYRIWEESAQEASGIKRSLILNLKNISLYCETEEIMRNCAIFCYKIVKEKTDLQLSELIENTEELRFIKANKHYSSKALVYGDEHGQIYDADDLTASQIRLRRNIPSRELYHFNILVQKPTSLVAWEFQLAAYDIRYGVYRVDSLRQMTLEEYEKGVDCKELVKMDKLSGISKGHLFLKNGVYRFVFDNTYSFVRAKDIFFSLLHMEVLA